jgi:acyl-CoA reductase-like NAD-dependent aldehyde dehydrogenase
MDSKETVETVCGVNPMTRGAAAQRSAVMSDQVTVVQEAQRVFETTWRAKWLADGAKTIEQMAEALEAEAAHLRELAAAGIELADVVEDDYAFLTTTDPEVAAKYEFEPVEEEEEGGVTVVGVGPADKVRP